jgi:hypothetical protein
VALNARVGPARVKFVVPARIAATPEVVGVMNTRRVDEESSALIRKFFVVPGW